VHWFYKGVVLEPIVTDANGKARVTFELPPRIGRYVLSASVRGERGWESARLASRVSGTEESWVQEFTLRLNGNPVDMDYLPIRRLYLTHGTSHVLELSAKKDSSLINETQVSLSGAPPVSLGLQFDPQLHIQRPVTATPLRWTIVTQPQAYGEFVVNLSSPDLPSRPLPAEVNV